MNQAAITIEAAGGLQAARSSSMETTSGYLHFQIGEAINRFLDEHDVNAGSRRAYGWGLKRYREFLQQFSADNRPDQRSVKAFRESLEAGGLSPHTIGLYMTAVRRFGSWLSAEYGVRNIADGVKGVKALKGKRRDALTDDQVRAMLDGINRSTIEGARDYAILNLQARLGLRAIEIVRLDVGDIQTLAGKRVIYLWGKGRSGKDEYLFLSPEAEIPINKYLRMRRKHNGCFDESEALFCSNSDRNRCRRLTTRSVSRIAKTAMRRAGMDSPRLTGHSLRHFMVSHLVPKTSVQAVMAVARHASIQTTMAYYHEHDRSLNPAELQISF